jgi:Domain of unknown function (DUF6285)
MDLRTWDETTSRLLKQQRESKRSFLETEAGIYFILNAYLQVRNIYGHKFTGTNLRAQTRQERKMQDRPSLKELTLAIREFLETEIAPALNDPRLKFRTLVAMNALGMIARESELEEGLLREECSAVLKLLGSNAGTPLEYAPLECAVEYAALKTQLREANIELAQRIRHGELPNGLFDHLERATRAKLEVSNPVFLKKFNEV